MLKLVNKIEKFLDGLMWNLFIFGTIFFILAILVLVDDSDYILRLVNASVIIVVGYTFIYFGFKTFFLKQDFDKHFNIKDNLKKIFNDKQ